MKTIVYSNSHSFSDELGIELIPMGIEGIEAGTPEEVISILKKDPSIGIILSENHEADFLQKIKEINPALNLFLLAHQDLKPEELKSLQKVGIFSVINQSENISLIAESLVKDIIRNNIKTDERRSHVRVQPKEIEKMKAAIFLKDLRKFVKGSVLDISAGGVALKLQDSLDASLLILKTVYDPLLISMSSVQIKTMARLVGKRNDGVGFKFENVEAKDMKIIASYIHTKITENTKK